MSDRLPLPARSPEQTASRSETDDEHLVYIGALRESVKAKVNADQRSGKSLAEIVATVREMVRLEEDNRQWKAVSPNVFRTVARQAVAWCLEFYKPLLVTPRDDNAPLPDGASPPQSLLTLSPTARKEGRLPLNYQPSGKLS